MSMILESKQLGLTRGELATFETAGDSGTMKQNRFWADCGTMIHGAIPGHEIIYLRPGTLDDTGWVRVEAQIFMKSKQPWVELSGDVPCFREKSLSPWLRRVSMLTYSSDCRGAQKGKYLC